MYDVRSPQQFLSPIYQYELELELQKGAQEYQEQQLVINEVAFVPQIECRVDVGKDNFTYVEGNDCTVAVSFRNQKFIYIIQFSKNNVQRIDLMD